MSTVFLQVGQCGNQIGHQLWKILKDEIEINNNTAFNRYTGLARCIAIDSEPRVIEKPFNKSSHPLHSVLNRDRSISTSSGRGNNWALGYLDAPENGTKLSHSTMEMLRKEAEDCDYYRGTVLIHSLAGGTGSGLGSKLLEKIRDEYPISFLLSAAVIPSESADTPLQDYNSCLSLSYMQDYTDGIIFFENDEVLRQVLYSNKRGSNASTHNINECIAYALANLFYPDRSNDFDWPSIMQDLVPSEDYKFIGAHTYPFIIDKQASLSREVGWLNIVESGLKNFPKYEENGQSSHQSISVKCYMRGEDLHNGVERQIKQFYNKISSHFRPVSWVDKSYLSFALLNGRAANPIYKIDRSVTIAANTTGILTALRRTIYNAKSKFQAGAYLHWYSKYNCENDKFLEAFEKIDGIIESYQSALKHNTDKSPLQRFSDILAEISLPPDAIAALTPRITI